VLDGLASAITQAGAAFGIAGQLFSGILGGIVSAFGGSKRKQRTGNTEADALLVKVVNEDGIGMAILNAVQGLIIGSSGEGIDGVTAQLHRQSSLLGV